VQSVYFPDNGGMNMKELITWLDEYLRLADFTSADISLNGLQIGRRAEEISKCIGRNFK